MKKNIILIFYSIALLMICGIYFSAHLQKKRLQKAIHTPVTLLSRIQANEIQLSNDLEKIRTMMPSLCPGQAEIDTLPISVIKVQPKNIHNLAASISSFMQADSLLKNMNSQTDSLPVKINEKFSDFHLLLSETKMLMAKYDSIAIQTNYLLKRFPQNIYVNFFHFEVLPLFPSKSSEPSAFNKQKLPVFTNFTEN
ncbi:MAG: hypothetical protein GXO83_06455 [Chlorobi bacterium]|nr:hypothetical protein [Chlorobiota bacterium]